MLLHNSSAAPNMRAEGLQAVRSTLNLITTNVPQRLDRLPWSRWHMWIVVALSVSWTLDGLEVTIIVAIGPAMAKTLDIVTGSLGSAYLLGSVIGALLFSHL